jgi:hypothetical protein
VVVLGAALCAALPRSVAARADNACGLVTTERIVAVGDVHGAYDNFVAILREAGLLDTAGHWSGGKAILVQTGDVMDRGPDSRKAMDLLRQLETESAAAGGQVHALIGNHEAMHMKGINRDASPGDFAAFVSPDAEKLRERAFQDAAVDAEAAARQAGKPFDQKAFRETFYAANPAGVGEMTAAFSRSGEYGKWILSHDATIRINDVLFEHGGPSAAIAKMGCARINASVHNDLQSSAPADSKSMSFRDDGPLWYRGLVDGGATDADVTAILKDLGVKAVVVGHTPRARDGIKPMFGGRVVPIDTGMLDTFYENGQASALEIAGTRLTAIYKGKRMVLSDRWPQ